jgi:hypothetical protein
MLFIDFRLVAFPARLVASQTSRLCFKTGRSSSKNGRSSRLVAFPPRLLVLSKAGRASSELSLHAMVPKDNSVNSLETPTVALRICGMRTTTVTTVILSHSLLCMTVNAMLRFAPLWYPFRASDSISIHRMCITCCARSEPCARHEMGRPLEGRPRE